MRIRYNFRCEFGTLPENETLINLTRSLDEEFKSNPLKFWNKYKQWLKPMNCLTPGHFFSMDTANDLPTPPKAFKNLEITCTRINENYVKLTFFQEDPIPYKIKN